MHASKHIIAKNKYPLDNGGCNAYKTKERKNRAT
jgi:hypothetical protein